MIEQIKKVAEKIEESETKKLLLESEVTHLEEVLKHGVSSRFAEENAIYIYSPKMGHEIRKKLEEDYKLMHPKLSIPKKIAEELLEFRKSLSDPDTELLGWGSIVNALYQYPEFSENFRAWWDERKGEANNLTIAYLNPLTRPFVEVEG